MTGIASRDKAKRRQLIAIETRAELVRRFPLCFMPKGADKKPLALQIDIPLRERCPDLSKSRIDAAIRDYVRGPKYLRNMVEGAVRVDLDGNPAGEVTKETAARCAEILEAITAFYAARGGDRKAAFDAMQAVIWRPQAAAISDGVA